MSHIEAGSGTNCTPLAVVYDAPAVRGSNSKRAVLPALTVAEPLKGGFVTVTPADTSKRELIVNVAPMVVLYIVETLPVPFGEESESFKLSPKGPSRSADATT